MTGIDGPRLDRQVAKVTGMADNLGVGWSIGLYRRSQWQWFGFRHNTKVAVCFRDLGLQGEQSLVLGTESIHYCTTCSTDSVVKDSATGCEVSSASFTCCWTSPTIFTTLA